LKKNEGCSYAQVTTGSVKDILKLKENFPNFSTKKIENIYKAINNISKSKSHINMIIKDLSHKQTIIPMGENNINKFMTLSDKYVANLNQALKDIKLDIFTNFICKDHQGLIIIAKKVILPSNLSMVENYIKNIHSINANDI